MGIYSTSIQISSGTNTASPLCDLESSAIEAPAILAIDFSIKITAGNILRIGIGRSSNTPVPIQSQLFGPEEPNDPACTSVIAVAWSLAPTIPTNFHRMFSAVGNVAENFLFTFPTGLRLVPSSSFVVWEIPAIVVGVLNIGWEIEI